MAQMFASAFLGALFQSLLPKLNYDKFLDFCRTAKVHSEAKKVMKLLQTLETVLEDAEEKQFQYPAVQVWVDDLRDVSYDLEVILDEFDTMQLQQELQIARAASLIKEIVSNSKFKWKFSSKVKEIASRLQDIRDRMEVLDLKPVYSRGESSAPPSQRLGIREKRETASGLTDSGLFVREAQKQELIDLVKNAASDTDSKRRVIAVVGTGGMGKTTLAQRVYHDIKESLIFDMKAFDMKAWVCISDHFQLMTVMENILREIGGDSSGSKSLQEVQKKIQGNIAGKTLLLFLDDAWERDHTEWERMWSSLHGATQIIVVLTTRDEQVASSSGALPNDHFLLHKLSDEDCLSVFQHYAFEGKDIDAYPMLKDIGVQIVKKCDGSPLAAKLVGGILRCKSTVPEWESVLHSRLMGNNSIKSILMLSYYHLHVPLKRCFAYLAIFPKDYEFKEQEIVLLWMAQGFLQLSNQIELEDVGRDYFGDLLSRSFFQASPNKKAAYVMHDLIHDLAQEVAGKTCFRLEEMMVTDQIHKLSPSTRYAFYSRKHEAIQYFRTFGEAHSLQTFFFDDYFQFFPWRTIDDTLCRLCHLRVLSLRKCIAVFELPHSVTKLKHLRYLDLSYTEIEVLQDSICTLVNLQTLLLKYCHDLVKLPDDLSNLVNIRHLDISWSSRITEMPFGLNNLKSLRTLSHFVVGKDIRHGIQQLKDLNQIKGSLCISELQNVTIPGDARQAMLKEKTKLRTLTMRWTKSNVDSNFQNMTENVLEELRPPQKLEKLTIEYFMGTKFPEWMGGSSFSNITSLSLRFCEKCTCLPPLGKLITLKHLHIEAFKTTVKADSHFYGELFPEPFSSLETLKFKDMPEWEHWFISDEVRIFPRLKLLSISECPKLLGKLPKQLFELEQLVIQGCKSLMVCVPSTLKLRRLEINECKEVTCNSFNGWSSLNSLILKNIEALTILKELKLGLRELEEVKTDCLKLVTEMPCRVEKLILEDCSLEKLPQVLLAKDSSFSLEVWRCPNLISFPDEINFSNNNSGDSNSTLSIIVFKCAALEYIPVFKMQDCCSTIVKIKIRHCDSLTGFGKRLLPRTLRRLELAYCNKLRCLLVEEEENKSNTDMQCPNIQLDELVIYSCDSLEYLAVTTRGKLPFRVKRLKISYGDNLESLIMSPLASSSSSSCMLAELPEELERLTIRGCPELKEVAESFHINNSNAIQSINFSGCGSLKCFPKGLHNIKSLKYFDVSNCEKLEAPLGCGIVDVVENNPALDRLNVVNWPAGYASLLIKGFQRTHTSLTTLDISYKKNTDLERWGLSRLVSLQALTLNGESAPDVVYFPKSISSGRGLFSYLYIEGFRNLKNIQGFKNLGSLHLLFIYECPELESFSKGGLPLSLKELHINDCPKLSERYNKNKKKMKARDWSKISHIPLIEIDNKNIHKIWLKTNKS